MKLRRKLSQNAQRSKLVPRPTEYFEDTIIIQPNKKSSCDPYQGQEVCIQISQPDLAVLASAKNVSQKLN